MKRYRIEHEGGATFYIYRDRLWGLVSDLIGVEYSLERAEVRMREAAQYPKYYEVP